ncbi:hypothetical protein [Streptomyces sp. NPDC046909]|uniref:hypothetical protein n=1 Tax=Streptomyces sp. NPDC046909 TaxID=3155617 RepID=UPI0033C90CF0
MASNISGKAIERSQRFLEPGEQVQRVVFAQGGINPWFQVVFFLVALIGLRIVTGGLLGGALGGLAGALLVNAFITRRLVLVTDRAVVVLEYGQFGGVKPKRVLARLPMGTGIGPLSGTWAQIELGGERLWVHKKWHEAAGAFVPTKLG